MEEKKDNKGIMLGVIIFLFVCLIAILFFMFKMVYVGDKTQQEETTTSDTTESSEEGFTELTKYELQEGEEKEITIGDKNFTIKKKDSRVYLNDKELELSSAGIYVTNKLIISIAHNQFGNLYSFYDLDLNKLSLNNSEGYRLTDLYLQDEKLLVKAEYNPTEWEEAQIIGNLIIQPCEIAQKNSKKLSEYQDVIKEHENDVLAGIYQIKYVNNQLNFELFESTQTVKQNLDSSDLTKMCAIEKNS